ncbi:hypothetical protein F5Y14DRAFT_452435 [Nemania sp. NC0429]|nr:hypothetical protein F5Y14DRAFT_452435 [Nemania sp. NC0429]
MASISSASAGKSEWLVVIPDKPGKQEKRLEVRPKHFGGLKPLVDSGFIKTGERTKEKVLNKETEKEEDEEEGPGRGTSRRKAEEAGALFNEKPESDDPSKFSFYGSSLICLASSKEEILELLSKDIYATSGVWDLDNVQIWPAKFAV